MYISYGNPLPAQIKMKVLTEDSELDEALVILTHTTGLVLDQLALTKLCDDHTNLLYPDDIVILDRIQ